MTVQAAARNRWLGGWAAGLVVLAVALAATGSVSARVDAGFGDDRVWCPAPPNVPGGADPWGGCWPGPSNTGVPDDLTLAPYYGPCRITIDGTVLSERRIDCPTLDVDAANVTIVRSRINGVVLAEDGLVVVDSTITVDTYGSSGATLLGYGGFTALRVEFDGGNRGVFCEHGCTVEDSWTHGQFTVGDAHVSGIRLSQGALLRHNSIECDAQNGGCSAPLTGYGDFEPVRDNLIVRNLFVSGGAGFCAYGGSSGSNGAKPYGGDAAQIRFLGNVFQRGESGLCGVYGPIADFDPTRPGNEWSDNVWDDGTTVGPN